MFFLIITTLFLIPVYLLWLALRYFLPDWYNVPPLMMTLFCVFMGFLTILAFHERLAGIAPHVTLLLFTLAWSLPMIPLSILNRYYEHKKSN